MSELASFHDVLFPIAISFGATGGPERRNEIVTLTSGREKRNARFSQSRRHYDAGTGVRSLSDLHEVLVFFEARRGSLHAFRFRDPFDMKSCRPGPGNLAARPAAGDRRRRSHTIQAHESIRDRRRCLSALHFQACADQLARGGRRRRTLGSGRLLV